MAVFGVIPNFPVQERWEWKTDVLQTIQGNESRISIRNKPRIDFAASFPALTAEQRRTLYRSISDNIQSTFETPLWPYAGPITQTTTSGNARVYFENSRVPVDGTGVLILVNPRTGVAYQHDVLTVQTDGATLATNVAVDITSEWVAIMGVQATIADNGGFTRGAEASDLTLRFRTYVDPGVQRPGSAASLTTLNSINVLERNFQQGAQERFSYPRETLDFESGTRIDYSQWDRPVVSGPRTFISQRLLDPTDLDYWRLFLDTVKGSWKPFLLSTQSKDMTLQSGLTQNASSFNINENIKSLLLDYETWQYLEILYTDGTKSYHQITSSSGSGPTTLNISPNTPNDPKVSGVSRISHLLKCRMADTLQLNHGMTTTEIAFDITSTDDG